MYYECKQKGDAKKAVEHLKASSSLGCREGTFLLGYAYENGDNGLKKDPDITFEYYKLGAKQGYDQAQFHASRLANELLGNAKKEIEYLKMVADQGHADAQNNLGIRYVDYGGAWIHGKNLPNFYFRCGVTAKTGHTFIDCSKCRSAVY